ncbi:unnamed protein product [Cylindrotheca closterium]|uniref:Uncharacterized protein n=1 Tax=Cylindrotheca closterium TaxID=2856 RepID=A0AAD2G0X0_9STRA|nr:unnamed protein product [Cylindrotheca closterium]
MEARSAMHILNAPSTKSLKYAIQSGLIKNCPITEEAINHAEAIFGPDASTLKGKSTRPTPKKTHNDFLSPPEELYQHNRSITNLKTDPVFETLDKIFRHCNKAGFQVKMIKCDQAFIPLTDDMLDNIGVTIDPTAAGDHEPTAEQNNRTLKERVRVALAHRKRKTKNEKHRTDRNFANGICSLSTKVYVEIAEVFINSLAFHCFTMGKYTSLKVVSTTANKAGGSTSKSVSVAKKSEEKRLENASAVDLCQPKDRDPSGNNISEIQELIAFFSPLIDFGLSTHDLVAIGYNYNSTKILFGNSIFNQWMETHNNWLTQALPRFDSPFKDPYANYSVEVRVNMLFAQYANDWRQALKFLISLFDDDAMGNVDKNMEYTWGVIEGFPNNETNKVEIHKGVKKIFDPDYKDLEEEDNPVGAKDTGLVNKFGQPDGWDSDETVDDNSNNRRHDMEIDGNFDSGDNRIHNDDDAKDEVEEDDEDTDKSTKNSVILVESS